METWKMIPGFSKYEVSDHGNVRNVLIDKVRGKKTQGGLIKIVPGRQGDPRRCVGIYEDSSGKQRRRTVARLLLMAFDRMPVEGEWARHLDDNLENDTLGNLAWGFRKDNDADAHRNKKYHAPKWSDERKAAYIETRRGVPHTEQSKANMSAGHANRKPMSERDKLKRSISGTKAQLARWAKIKTSN